MIVIPDGEESVPGDLEGLVGVVSGEPWVVEALVGRHPLFLLLGQQPLDELLALLTHVDKGLLVKLPSTRLPRGHSISTYARGGGEGVSKFRTNAYRGGGGVWPLSTSARAPEGRRFFL